MVEPRFNVLTYKKWLEKGRQVKKGEKGFSVGPFKLFHKDQTELKGSSDLPVPIECVIPQQPKDSDPGHIDAPGFQAIKQRLRLITNPNQKSME